MGRAVMGAAGLVGFVLWSYTWDVTSQSVRIPAEANQWRAVNHEVFSAARYDGRERVLHLEFHDGRRYAYEGVDGSTYLQFMHVPAKARYFNERIRDVYWCRPEDAE